MFLRGLWIGAIVVLPAVRAAAQIDGEFETSRPGATVPRVRDDEPRRPALGPRVRPQGERFSSSSTDALGWRSPDGARPEMSGRERRLVGASAPVRETKATGARVSKGNGTLPNDHGQIWREYDISPYTTRVTSTNKPEQAIVDWILRETGYEVWHSEPLGLLSANSRTLRCYHTPEIQAIVAEIVDRFVSSEADTYAFGLRIITVESPNWRTKSMRLLKPVPVQSQGVQGWLLQKEDAAVLMADMRRRSDFREHSSPHMLVNNGQSTVVSTIRDRSYIRGLLPIRTWPGYEPDKGKVEQGYALEFSPLLSIDRRTVDAIIKLRLCQVEKMVPVMVDVPTTAAPNQRAQVEVPQMIATNLHERFRWPADQVLLLSMGVVAMPGPSGGGPLGVRIPFISGDPGRADALLFVEPKGKVASSGASTVSTAGNTRRRY